MNLQWLPGAWDDYLYWQKTDQKQLKRINLIIKDALRNPFTGLGKPEPLKANFSGWWSRRINAEHRLVYCSENDQLIIMQCRHHYQ